MVRSERCSAGYFSLIHASVITFPNPHRCLCLQQDASADHNISPCRAAPASAAVDCTTVHLEIKVLGRVLVATMAAFTSDRFIVVH